MEGSTQEVVLDGFRSISLKTAIRSDFVRLPGEYPLESMGIPMTRSRRRSVLPIALMLFIWAGPSAEEAPGRETDPDGSGQLLWEFDTGG